MHGLEQNLQKMMMKIGKVIIVIMPFRQGQSRAIVKVTVEVKAVPKKRTMLSQRQSTQEITASAEALFAAGNTVTPTTAAETTGTATPPQSDVRIIDYVCTMGRRV
jgi:hypothetical protein